MNFFRKIINSVAKRQVIADMYDEPSQPMQPRVVAPQMPAPETEVPQDVQPEQAVQPKPTYTRDKSRRQRMQRMRDMDQSRGMEKEEGYLGYTAKEFTTVLPMMMDNLKMFFTPGMSIAEVYDLHEISPDFQSLFLVHKHIKEIHLHILHFHKKDFCSCQFHQNSFYLI